MFCKFLLYFNTVKYLKIKQILYRFKFLISAKYPKKKYYTFTVNDHNKIKYNWIFKNTYYPVKNQFKFLNKRYLVKDFKPIKKINDYKLWTYNLNYFDFLITPKGIKNKKQSLRIIKNWINLDPVQNKIGWEPYPTSIRIVNWIKWCLLTKTSNRNIFNSLYTQIVHLEKNIEWHLLGNHIIANAKAFIFFGSFFKENKLNLILRKGEKILHNELKEQFLNDGGHFERSPMYHSILIEDLLDIKELDKIFPNKINSILINKLNKVIEKGLVWLNFLCHPDKNISFFNDTCLGISSNPLQLNNFYKIVFNKIKPDLYSNKKSYSKHLQDSGFYIFNSIEYKTLVDLGSISPEYQPGHSHAETFSFEVSIFNERVFVNSGISQYEIGKRRMLERGTAAHNTVCALYKNSSEIWSSFRVARRAKVTKIRFHKNKASEMVEMTHNGYERILRSLTHYRKFVFKKKYISIQDIISKKVDCFAVLILHPDVKIINSDNKFSIRLRCNKKINLKFNKSNVIVKDWLYAPKFGVLQKTKCFHIYPNNNKIDTHIFWE